MSRLSLTLFKRLLAATAAAILAPTCALASTLVESYAIPETPVSYTDSFSLPAFNTSLGTLTGVTLQFNSSLTVDFEVVNAMPGGPFGYRAGFSQATASVPLSITGPGSLSLSDTVSITPFSGVTWAGPGVTEFPGLTGSSSASYVVPLADLSAFESANPLDLDFAVEVDDASYSGLAPPLVGFRGSTQGGSTNVGVGVDVTYSYTPFADAVPEPSTWAMLLVGFGGIGAVARRRPRTALAR